MAYVAATRARDLLVIPSVGDEELEGWLGPLNKAIYPAHDRYRHATRAVGCPDFGDASVVDRPFFAHDEPSVQPGLHAPQQGTHEVVWWDPRTLTFAPPANLGLRQEEILKGDPKDEESPSLIAYREWKEKRDETIAAGAEKQFDIFPVTAAPDSAMATAVRFETVQKAASRSTGARFGTLVHTILRDVPLDGTHIDELAKVHGRIFGATDQEVKDAATAVAAALQHSAIGASAKVETVPARIADPVKARTQPDSGGRDRSGV